MFKVPNKVRIRGFGAEVVDRFPTGLQKVLEKLPFSSECGSQQTPGPTGLRILGL